MIQFNYTLLYNIIMYIMSMTICIIIYDASDLGLSGSRPVLVISASDLGLVSGDLGLVSGDLGLVLQYIIKSVCLNYSCNMYVLLGIYDRY